MILEGLVTTTNPDGSTNIAPMGPIVDTSMTQLLLRPYGSSTTGANLERTCEGIFHVTDDVELMASAAIRRLSELPPLLQIEGVTGRVIANCCRWYAFRVVEQEDAQEPKRLTCRVVAEGERRAFLGFNRAKHAVIEGAILATRVHLLSAELIDQEFQRLQTIVDKTGGDAEHRAFSLLTQYLREHPKRATTCDPSS